MHAASLLLACVPLSRALALSATADMSPEGNFRYIYNNPQYRAEFLDFLTNVFHLYPEDAMHETIAQATQQYPTDEEIYTNLQNAMGDIKPFLADLTYAVPALLKQKQVMAEQTKALLGSDRRYEGYLEFGSTGRYLDALEEQVDIAGDIHFISERPATFSPPDIIDRGQIFKAGSDIDLSGYRPISGQGIEEGSIDLVTVYIGFHHCPVELREAFIGSIRNAMSPDGKLILRDHDAYNEKMKRMVALAHDVFNMGTQESWTYNHDELRNFYSLAELDAMLVGYGFKSDGSRIYQEGDPTRNALMVYKKA